MKIYAILRGFPGLGRVIAGFELLKHFEINYKAEIKISTYFQGENYINSKGCNTSIKIDDKDVSSVGIISVSKSGEKIIEDILLFNPDLVLIDGEPILLHNLKISYPGLYVISLLNPFDINNPHNQKSSQDFFIHMFSFADFSIVHGLWHEKKPVGFNKYISINSIVRDSINEIPKTENSKTIVCLLGGGSKSVNSGFTSGTIEIAKQVIDIAQIIKKINFKIYTSDLYIKTEILRHISICDIRAENISLIDCITDETEIYKKASMVIARAGRNTISELLTMNMPSIIIPTTSNFRGSEQLRNCKKIISDNYTNIKAHYLEEGSNALKLKMLQLIDTSINNNEVFRPGNKTAFKAIIDTLNEQTSNKLIELETNAN